MINGSKPLSIFHRFSGEIFDEFDGQDFDKYVKSGRIHKRKFFLYYNEYNRSMIYTAFFLEGEEWRFNSYKNLVKTLMNGWSLEKEAISCYLLGYSFKETNNYIKDYMKYMALQ